MKTYKCLIWGIGKGYNNNYNKIQLEILKRNIEIVAFISKDIVSPRLDGYDVVDKSEIVNLQFDYIIVMSTTYLKDIKNDIEALGIESDKAISIQVFDIPCFDFGRYVSLLENPITLVSDDCWGGYLYHYLYLKFSSPFINISWKKEDFLKILNHFKYYMESSLVMKQESNLIECQWPVGIIGEGDMEIEVNFIHAINFAKAREEWDKRRKRINNNNILVKMSIGGSNEEYILKEYENTPFEYKYCFCSYESDSPCTIHLPRYEWSLKQEKKFVQSYAYDFYIRRMDYQALSIDLLKFLNHESDFIRE